MLAETYVTVDAERSRLVRPGRQLPAARQRLQANNLDSDFFFQQIIDSGIIEKLLAQAAAGRAAARGQRGRARLRRGLQQVPGRRRRGGRCHRPGAARASRGCSRSPRRTPTGASTSCRCSPARTSRSAASATAAARRAPRCRRPPTTRRRAQRPRPSNLPIGGRSARNAVALGRDGTAQRQRAAARQPALPLARPERFYQAHLTIPGKVDVSGGALFGVPLVLIGHTDDWPGATRSRPPSASRRTS